MCAALVPWNNDELEDPVDPQDALEDLRNKLRGRTAKRLSYVFQSLGLTSRKDQKMTKDGYASALRTWVSFNLQLFLNTQWTNAMIQRYNLEDAMVIKTSIAAPTQVWQRNSHESNRRSDQRH